jgi:hypothetical protein
LVVASQTAGRQQVVFVLPVQDARLVLNQPRILHRDRCLETDAALFVRLLPASALLPRIAKHDSVMLITSFRLVVG